MGYERNPRDDRGGYDDRDQRDRYGRDPYGSREVGAGAGGRSQSPYDSYGDGRRQDFGYPGNQDQTYRDGGFQGRGGYGGGERDQQSRSYQGYGTAQRRPSQGYDHDDRGFFDRAGDEVRSWFGDEEANRRRDLDARYDEQRYGDQRDDHYHNWRRGQIDALDRDYDEYRRENRTKFDSEFGTWRSQRQGQRDSLSQVEEHMDVVGSDGAHVGKVDKVRGDRIILTKNDADAGGRHHSIPSRWIKTVDGTVTIDKTADEAKRQWKDEERSQAFFNEPERPRGQDKDGPHVLGKSFSGTY